VLRAYGIKTPIEKIATNRTEAALFATEIGFPVVLKILSPDIVHKTDVGGVIANIQDPLRASEAFERIISNVRIKKPKARIQGVLVQNQLSGVEILIGSTVDEQFGPIMTFGLGGIFAEVFRDISIGFAPLTEQESMRMINETKAAKILAGMRGYPPADIKSLVETMIRASLLAVEQQIMEMDLNPVIVSPTSCVAADARIRIKIH
ncbi:MAG: acetate--CoA ligase family protein, partial [Candidatus Bathyarchaeia archaeon]